MTVYSFADEDGNVREKRTITPAVGGSQAPLTLTGTDPVSAPELSVVASPDQTTGDDETSLTEVRDSDANLLWATEFDGGVRFAVDLRLQRLTDTNGPVFAVAAAGHTSWNDSNGSPIAELYPEPTLTGPVMGFNTPDGHVTVQIYADATGAKNAVEVYGLPDFNLVFAVTATGGIRATLPASNPGPGLLWNDAGTVKVGT